MDVMENYVMQKESRKEKSICPSCIHHNLCIAENNQPCFECNRFIDANGVTVQEWISVAERLPDWRDGKVLVFTKYGFSICERTVNNRWRGQHANWITHWAYLPQPPKGE